MPSSHAELCTVTCHRSYQICDTVRSQRTFTSSHLWSCHLSTAYFQHAKRLQHYVSLPRYVSRQNKLIKECVDPLPTPEPASRPRRVVGAPHCGWRRSLLHVRRQHVAVLSTTQLCPVMTTIASRPCGSCLNPGSSQT